MSTTTFSVSDILEKAAQVIERDGWIQHETATQDGVCAYGALQRAVIELTPDQKLRMRQTEKWPHTAREAYSEAVERLRRQVNHPFLADWNDSPDRAKFHVVNALRKAAQS